MTPGSPHLEHLQIAIVTVSDSRSKGEAADTASGLLKASIERLGGTVLRRLLVPDEVTEIAAGLRELTDQPGLDLVLTTGGTGLGPRDRTPEATLAVGDIAVPGLAELMRAESAAITPMAWLSRAVVVVRGAAIIANLPGNPRGAVECLDILAPHLKHAIHVTRGGGHSERRTDVEHTGQSARGRSSMR